jgi:nitrogenase iron protein NifH
MNNPNGFYRDPSSVSTMSVFDHDLSAELVHGAKKGGRAKHIAFYGKGGIGKSTIASNVAAAYAEQGFKVMFVGCDPKADCTRNLRGDVEISTVLDVLREKGIEKLDISEIVEGKKVEVDEVVHKGYRGVLCVEVGGPEPAIGCAGRGIILAIEVLNKLGAFEKFKPDVVIYDVPGDIVCGGFGMPLRRGLANEVYIVTSADYLSIYAANNICRGVRRLAKRGGALLGGIIYNVRGAVDDISIVEEFARRVGAKVVGAVPRDPTIAECEVYAKTVIEYRPESKMADLFRGLAKRIYENEEVVVPTPLSKRDLAELAQKIRQKRVASVP